MTTSGHHFNKMEVGSDLGTRLYAGSHQSYHMTGGEGIMSHVTDSRLHCPSTSTPAKLRW